MTKIKKYQNFLNESSTEEEDALECLEDFIEKDGDFYNFLKAELDQKGLSLEEIHVSSADCFVIEFGTQDYAGCLPNKISYYIEEIHSKIKDLVPTTVVDNWNFGTNYQCNIVQFYMKDMIESPMYYKIKKAREALKYS
jgi:hypothetical protein